MAYKLVNKTNGNELKKYISTENVLKLKDFETEEEYNEYLQSLEKKRDFAKEMFCDNIQAAKTGKIVICKTWEQVDEILDCFDNTDAWIFEKIQGVFYIITEPTNTRLNNKFKAFKEALKRGEIVDFES